MKVTVLPTCTRMVLSYLELERDEADLSQILGTKKYGTPSFATERLSDPLMYGYSIW